MVNEVMDFITAADPQVGQAIRAEYDRQQQNIELIASENIVSAAVLAAAGTVLTNKYAEGYPGKRYYGGCQCVDVVANIAIERAKELFGANYANVQPHSGAQANFAVYQALCQHGALEKLMATIRSREISACLVLQAQSQLKALYKDNADTIIGNCDSRLFLGGSEPSTLKELSQSLGKETIDTYNTGESRGRETSHSLNYQKLGRELMSMDDLATLDGNKCILQVRGLRPFLSDKYDITKHPNYKYLSDADPKNTFDVEKYMSRRLKLKADEEYDVYEIDEEAAP